MAIPLPEGAVEEAARLYVKHGGHIANAARERGIHKATFTNHLQNAFRQGLVEPIDRSARMINLPAPLGEIRRTLPDGVIVAFSDAHYWPGLVSTAHRALLALCHKLKPNMIVANGDVFDGAALSRHDPIGWATLPSAKQELDVVTERMKEVKAAACGAELIWTTGNHDARWERKLASKVPEFAGVDGFSLRDHFPDWERCVSLLVNENLMLLHAIRGGVHATHNNTLHAGISTVTGHLHQLKVTPFADYRGRRWGIDCGTLAHPNWPQFEYTLNTPKNWGEGFAVLTIRNGQLVEPELCSVIDGVAWFRGDAIAGV